MELFCILLFLPDWVSYFTPINWLTLSMKLRTFILPMRSKLERKSATFIGSITFRRELKRHYINFGELVCWRVGCRRIGLSASWFVGGGLLASWSVGELSINRCFATLHTDIAVHQGKETRTQRRCFLYCSDLRLCIRNLPVYRDDIRDTWTLGVPSCFTHFFIRWMKVVRIGALFADWSCAF